MWLITKLTIFSNFLSFFFESTWLSNYYHSIGGWPNLLIYLMKFLKMGFDSRHLKNGKLLHTHGFNYFYAINFSIYFFFCTKNSFIYDTHFCVSFLFFVFLAYFLYLRLYYYYYYYFNFYSWISLKFHQYFLVGFVGHSLLVHY